MKRRIATPVLLVFGMLAVTASGQTAIGTGLVLDGLAFEVGSAEFTAGSTTYLDGIVAMLVAAPASTVEVGGHTDSSGPADLNRDLSRRRAESVRRYLLDHGIAADRVAAVGYGEDYPIADNATAEGRAANRRVELKPTDS